MSLPAVPLANMRSRWRLAVCLLATVALAWLSRRYPLPGGLAEYPGDALYTVAAFWTLALAWPRAGRARLALAAFAFSATVESSQLLDWQWLDALRATRAGALLLGQGFQWQDLVAYAIGAIVATAFDAGSGRRLRADDRIRAPHHRSP